MNILIISVHPDDETLGCGGTILKHREKEDNLFWLILTQPIEAEGFTESFISARKKQIESVAKAYQFKDIFTLDFGATRLHAADFSKLINDITSVISQVKPEWIYTVNRSDIHTDHQVAAKAVMSCTKSFRTPFIRRILMYECISETEIAPPFPENVFLPNVFSDISLFIDKKTDIMKIYESEIQEQPLPRSIENIKALARFRGASVNMAHAEAFMLVRDLF